MNYVKRKDMAVKDGYERSLIIGKFHHLTWSLENSKLPSMWRLG
jgi:hypothetical protein